MKFIKKIAVLLLSLIALVLIIALFVKKDYHIFRSVEINADKEVVFEYLRYLENQNEFSVWPNKDPNVNQSYTGTDGTVGAIYHWDSKVEEVGAGEQEIMKIEDGKRIDFELRFKRPMEMEGGAYFTTIPTSDDGTNVTWGFEGRIPWPWNFFLLFNDMDAELGPDLQKGLSALKIIIESPE